MPMPRREGDHDLPRNIYNRKGTYFYRNPLTVKEVSLGSDRHVAVAFGIKARLADEQRKVTTIAARMQREMATRHIPDVDNRALLTLSAIADLARPATVCGVYFLLKAEAVMYVGQSRDCERRVATHRTEKRDFDTYYVLPVARMALNEIEAAYIAKFDPPLNRARPKDLGRNVALTMMCAQYEPEVSEPVSD